MIPPGLTIRHNSSTVPNVPWLAPDATEAVESFLRADMDVFEWGSGGSTCWFAKRVRSVTSMEHDLDWYESVAGEIDALGLTNIKQLFIKDRDDYIHGRVGVYDVILIDGEPGTRIECLKLAMNRLRKSGMLVCDDFEWDEFSEGRELLSDWEKASYIKENHSTILYRRC